MSSPTTIAPTEQAPPNKDKFTSPSVEDLQTFLPQYEILEQIGAGGMGAVYKARQPKLDRIVAIKILPTDLDDKYEFKERFRREARAMARLQHPGIVSVYEFGETDSPDHETLLYIVMEYVEGADLNYLIKTATLDFDQILAVIKQICEALQYAHDQNIIHRDIKPANIMLNMDGHIKIADFGLAKILSTDSNIEPSLTGTNIVMGTLDYLAPEQMIAGSSIDQRVDLYAIGVLIYEMLTGEAPRGAFDLPSKKVAGLDPRLDRLILRSMATDPADRFQNATELSTAIINICTPEPEPKPAPEATITDPNTNANPSWASDTAQPAPLSPSQQPATQADLQAAIKATALEATRVAQAAQVTAAANVKEASNFLPHLYSLAKTLMVLTVITLAAILLGFIAWVKWPQISQFLTQNDSPTHTKKQQITPPTTTATQTPPPQRTPTSSGTTIFPGPQPPGPPPPPGRRQKR